MRVPDDVPAILRALDAVEREFNVKVTRNGEIVQAMSQIMTLQELIRWRYELPEERGEDA